MGSYFEKKNKQTNERRKMKEHYGRTKGPCWNIVSFVFFCFCLIDLFFYFLSRPSSLRFFSFAPKQKRNAVGPFGDSNHEKKRETFSKKKQKKRNEKMAALKFSFFQIFALTPQTEWNAPDPKGPNKKKAKKKHE